MITLLTASPGIGKTNHAVWSYIKPAVDSGRVVYVNRIPDLKLPHIKLTDKQLNSWHERTYDDPEDTEGTCKLNNILEGSLIVVDEARYPWPAIDIKDPPEYIKYLSQHRKHSLDFLVITQSPKFVHPDVLENADRHIHLRGEWTGAKSYEWAEYCPSPKLKTHRDNAVKKPYKLVKEAFPLYYSASQHLEKPKRTIPTMFYVALLMLFAVPAMAYMSFMTVYDKYENPIGSNMTFLEGQKNDQTAKQGTDTQPDFIPVSQPAIVNNAPIKQSLSMLSESIDWAQVSACVSNDTNCICYGHNAQRLNVDPQSCSAAVIYGWDKGTKL
jgi:zona occludens toxin